MATFLTIKEILDWAKKLLQQSQVPDFTYEAEFILAWLLGTGRFDLYINKENFVSDTVVNKYKKIIKQRAKRIPSAYLLREVEFMGLNFFILPGVFIPRPETELLVERIISRINPKADIKILDLCCGCGNIAISLAYYLKNSVIYAIDNNPLAIKLTQENALRYGLENRIKIFEGDLFSPLYKLQPLPKLDFVLTNPPYVKREFLNDLMPEVKIEPQEALDGGEDGLKFYRQIIDESIFFLKPNGVLGMEIDPDLLSAIVNILKEKNFVKILPLKDYSNLERIILAQRRFNEKHHN